MYLHSVSAAQCHWNRFFLDMNSGSFKGSSGSVNEYLMCMGFKAFGSAVFTLINTSRGSNIGPVEVRVSANPDEVGKGVVR